MAEAIAKYPSATFAIAEDSRGQVASWQPATQPHQLITGCSCGPESATTAAIQTLAAQCARAHWAVHITASHDDPGYRQLRNWPNVRCVATRPAEQTALLTHLEDVLRHRQLNGGVHRDAPLVLFIDGWHELANPSPENRGRHDPATTALAMLLRLGRSMRIHVVMAQNPGPVIDIDIRFNFGSELHLHTNPYLPEHAQIGRRLAALRPTRPSYPSIQRGRP